MQGPQAWTSSQIYVGNLTELSNILACIEWQSTASEQPENIIAAYS